MDNIQLLITPALEAYLIGLTYRNTRTSCLVLAQLCARFSHDTLRRVLFLAQPWSRRLWVCCAAHLVREGGYLVVDDTSWSRYAAVAEAVWWVWSATVGKPVWGMQVVLLLWTDGHWKVPLGIRLWRPGGASKVKLAAGLLREAQRRGLRPDYVLFDSWYGAAEILNLLQALGWQYVARLKSNRLLDGVRVSRKWPQRYGHTRGQLRKVNHEVLVVKDGRRFFVTNVVALLPCEVKRHYRFRQQIEEVFRLLKQEFGWGHCRARKAQAQWAHLHLGLYALCLTQQAAFARQQTIYAFRQTLFCERLPAHLLLIEEVARDA